MARKKEKPGMMLYWSMFDVLEALLDGQAKTMLHVMRNYSQYGEIPEFENDPGLKTLWFIVKPQIDADTERYENVKQQRTNAINSRWERERSKKEYGSIQPYTDEYGSIRNIPITDTVPNTVSITDPNTFTDSKSFSVNKGNNVLKGEKGAKLDSRPQSYTPFPSASAMAEMAREAEALKRKGAKNG